MAEIENRTYYELLGVEPTASVEEIKEAYREIARIFHPDSNFYADIIDDGPGDNDVIKVITQAYQVLINEDKRRAYDETLKKSYSSWGDDAETQGPTTYRANDEESPKVKPAKDAQGGEGEEIPEEWRKERQYFEEHFEEILKPAPKANLVGSGEDTPEGPQVQLTGWEEFDQSTPVKQGFGIINDDEELSLPVSPPPLRRQSGGGGIDPLDIIVYFGMPVMFVIVVLEVLLFL